MKRYREPRRPALAGLVAAVSPFTEVPNAFIRSSGDRIHLVDCSRRTGAALSAPHACPSGLNAVNSPSLRLQLRKAAPGNCLSVVHKTLKLRFSPIVQSLKKRQKLAAEKICGRQVRRQLSGIHTIPQGFAHKSYEAIFLWNMAKSLMNETGSAQADIFRSLSSF
ncbi:hypothetical protein BPOR_0608g00040 [Botrytis porri]|uniref:Uncharacterized protein n=1 Tax=Botrytis porri TaxID=87229 RepID=A0A4Z1KBX2_9HELO|nr:hypothetical protein BPOR_0608g00040 [Botrytis porri]